MDSELENTIDELTKTYQRRVDALESREQEKDIQILNLKKEIYNLQQILDNIKSPKPVSRFEIKEEHSNNHTEVNGIEEIKGE